MLSFLILSAALLSAEPLSGFEMPQTDTLHSVTVVSDKGVVVSRADTLSFSNSFSVTDVLQTSPGIYVGDNGGLAGLKTVSLRGMGSAHTAVYLDGVRMGNVQSGQNDLGMLALDNLESAVVDYAQNSVSFNTVRPKFGNGPVAGNIRLSAGSFGTWLPSARLDFRLSDKMSLSTNVSGVFTDGDYSYGDGQVRKNNNIGQIRAGVDLFGRMKAGDYHLKAYYNHAERGTPGSVDWPSDDRQEDMNVFVQGVLRKNFSPRYTLRLSSKASYDDIFYTGSWGDSRYGQTELQLNSSHDFQIRRWLKLSFAADAQWDGLKSSSYDASRLSAFSALASSFRVGSFSADVSLEYNGAFDKDALSRQVFSPSLGLGYRVAEGFALSGFARRAYRVPTFNELYYLGYGNPDLRPEDAWLTGLGADFNHAISSSWSVKARVDGFYNVLIDKIVSAPTETDPNIWLPYNIGEVRSVGVDVVAGFAHNGTWSYSIDAKWSFQSATDMTSDSFSYGQQIPYVARNTIIIDGNVSWSGWSLTPLWQLRSGRTDGIGELPDWSTLDVTFAKTFALRNIGKIDLRLLSKNLLDRRYEVVTGYPMPGRSLMFGVELKF